MASKRPRPKATEPSPPGFEIVRDVPLGRHALLSVFPGLDKLPTAERLEPKPELRTQLFQETCVEVVKDDVWMYVAPFEIPTVTRGRWKPVISPDSDCIVVGAKHLRKSSSLMLFMDIYHELSHVRQRKDGATLFDGSVSYVRRWTEVEAYRFVVDEARDFGVGDDFLRDYLRVEWISDAEHKELLATLHVSAK